MDTTVDEVAEDVFRISTWVSGIGPDGFTFNQYLVRADEPLLFHTGHRSMFPAVSQAIDSVVGLEALRWISFGHFESDECGAMNELLAAAPRAEIVNGELACLISINEVADRTPRAVADGEVVDLGGRQVRYLATPHVPHCWDAGLLYEETTSTLFCGDLFTHMGRASAEPSGDILGPAIAAESLFGATALTPSTGPTIRRLADLGATTLATMHGSAFAGDTGGALADLATYFDDQMAAALD
jgi:flavorubredoxin